MNSQHFIVIENMRPIMSVGIYAEEKTKTQPVEINLRLEISAPDHVQGLDETVCYHTLYTDMDSLCRSRHFDLLEELAEAITALCLSRKRVKTVRLKLTKPEAIEGSTQVGVELVTSRL